MSNPVTLSKKIAVVAIYFFFWLSSFQIKEVIIHPNVSNLSKVLFSLVAGFIFAYMNGFELFKIPNKKKSTTSP